jgi:hypothetical protein
MITMIIIICGIVLFGAGIVIGYYYCACINKRLFQAWVDSGVVIVMTEEGWSGTEEAIASTRMQAAREGKK